MAFPVRDGAAPSQADKDAFVTKAQSYPDWQAEIVVEIQVG